MKKIVFFMLMIALQSCFQKEEKYSKKGFQVSQILEDEKGNKIVGLPIDSLNFETRPQKVLPTHYAKYKLTPIFKVNYDKNFKINSEKNFKINSEKRGVPSTGSVHYHYNYEHFDPENYYNLVTNNGEEVRIRKKIVKNNWNDHLLPGFSAVTGYNIVNLSLYDTEIKKQKNFFEKPVLVKTIYFPSQSTDTLNYQPVKRNFYMVSVYDADTNKDGFINIQDLRRFYLFDLEGNKTKKFFADNLSVFRSNYDEDNDLMQVFARLDKNGNGQIDEEEPTEIHWIDLKNPQNTGVLYSE